MTDLWLSLETIREEWPDALVSDESLAAILLTAQEQIVAYAPPSLTNELEFLSHPDDPDLPPRLRTALLMQAREIWRAGERDGDVLGIGASDTAVRAPDMTASVKKVLRPRHATWRAK